MATTRVGVRKATRAALAVYAASLSLPALSLGLGEISMQSFLNEPLRAQVGLLDVRDLNVEDIRIRLARVEDFERLGVDRSYFLTSIEFDVALDPATGRGVIRLTSPDAVLEPYLDLIIEARWPQGRVLREYTVLVDPPAFRQEVISVSASERVQAARPEKPAVAPQPGGAASAAAGAGAGAGDNVALRPSSLPPGEMPDRAFSAETAATPTAGNRYMVKRDETLWEIAAAGRPGDVSVQQAMLNIQRLNPEAFIDGNINRIKAGYIIYLPSIGEVSSENLAAALEEVRAQNRAFNEGAPTPGVTAAATLRVSADTAAVIEDGASTDQPRAAAPATPSEADAGQDMTGGDAPRAAEAPSALAEAGAGADAELAAQLATVSERLDTLEQIVSLKDEQIATLEQALREARETAAAASATTPASPAPASPTRISVVPPPASAPSVPWLPIGGAAIAVLLAIILFLRRRASRDTTLAEALPAASAGDDDADVFKGVSLRSEALADAGDDAKAEAPDAAEEEDPSLARGGSRGYGERKNDDYIDDGAAGDALAEADIYIAYGRYLQAIELLDAAIENEPDNSAYRLKLTELYVDMGEEENAAAQLAALREQGDPDAIERAEALLGSAAPAATEAAPASSPEPGAPAPADTPAATPPAAHQRLDEADREMDQAAKRAAIDGAIHEGINEARDKARDEASDEAADEAIPGIGAVDPASAAPAEELDLDLDFGEPDLQVDLEEESEPQAGISSGAEDDEAARAAVGISDPVDTAEPLEFDQLEIEDERDSGGERDDRLDLDGADDTLDLTDALPEFLSASNDGDVQDDDDDDDGELLIADEADQMATKLDLARAYLDMGDSEGARGILEEVASGGATDLQKEARDLLERIA